MKTIMKICALSVLAAFAAGLGGCAKVQPGVACEKDQERIAANLANFDDLDFNVYSGQKWDELSRSHAKGIVVHWPDGRTTKGIGIHIEDLKGMFVWAPDTRIETHPIKVAQGEWTAVIGVIQGTFTRPMPIGEGKFIQPTGKSFKLTMSTFGHWTDKGTMDEEYLFWDNQEFMRQIGLGQ
ncbi:ester cyclase [Sulfurimonas sp. HSL-3221]|uniref:ester cyclase n=1 Tax=Sulfurimonadaceae TaxID=2771471 RepID=UPI001E338B9E|nr:ester cyclase [Sulfurimonas sp. HSL-3221]UFS63580.1 ester cyclase [Sulfurimonas sp. HSL-3221]